MADLYGAVLGNRLYQVESQVNGNMGFSISEYLAKYFSPNGDWFSVASEFVRVYKPFEKEGQWRDCLYTAAHALGRNEFGIKVSLRYLEDMSERYHYNTEYFNTRLNSMLKQGR